MKQVIKLDCTLPHLKDFRNASKLMAKRYTEEFVTDFINEHKTFFESNDMSFEMTVGLAFEYLKRKK
jgi:dihydrofolate synthase/folylpolyglutamate synthase